MERRSAEKRPPFGMWDRDLLEEAYCMYMPLNHQVSSISALRNAQGHGIATQREWISRQGDALAEALEHVDDAFFRVAKVGPRLHCHFNFVVEITSVEERVHSRFENSTRGELSVPLVI